MKTYQDVLSAHDVTIPAHLEAQAEVPVLSGVQRQGDVIVVPHRPGMNSWTTTKVPAGGVAVVRGEAGGNTHLLVADGDVSWAINPHAGATDLALGMMTVTEGSVAYLLHPEHGAQAFAPGVYRVGRQREQAEEIRMVAD